MSTKTKPAAEIATITPTKAKRLLKGNTANRPVNTAHVRELADRMKSSEFVFNGDAIRVAIDGRVLDGQHRLAACVMAGVSFQSVLVTDLPMVQGDISTQDTIDQGVKRTVGHQLVMDGYDRGIANTLGAALRIMHQLDAWIDGKREVPKEAHRYDPIKARRDLERHPEMVKYVRKAIRIGKTGTAKPSASYVTALWRKFGLIDEAHADEFWESFHVYDLGNGAPAPKPVTMLREEIVRQRIDAGGGPSKANKVDPYWLCGLSITAWNAFRDGRKPRSLTFVPGEDEFPVPH